MVEHSSSNVSTSSNQANKFKFCYIIRGLPGSGKSTVASQLAGQVGVVLNLDSKVHRHSQTSKDGSESAADDLVQIQKKHYEEFCAEVRKGTQIIVVDNSNIKESEYEHFIEFAQQEHYLTSVVTLPAPHDLEVAAQRSTQDITVTELSQMLNMYEPTSLAKLARKGAAMHEAASKGGLRVSPH